MHFSTRFAVETTRKSILEDLAAGFGPTATAKNHHVSRRMVYRWRQRADCASRSSRPNSSPCKTPAQLEAQVKLLREQTGRGPRWLAQQLHMPHSTVYKILVRLKINKLAPPEGLPLPGQRYEHAHPGGLLHVDVKKLHRIGLRTRPAGPGECVHVVLDDHSRVVYQETHPDERALTAAAVLERAVAWFASLGVTCQRVLTDNHPTYRSDIWRHTCQLLQMRPMRTRPRRPQTNGKVERWNRTLLNEALRRRIFDSTQARAAAIDNFVNAYNAHRPHTALGGKTPLERLFKV